MNYDDWKLQAPPCDDADTREEADRLAELDHHLDEVSAAEEAALTLADEDDDGRDNWDGSDDVDADDLEAAE